MKTSYTYNVKLLKQVLEIILQRHITNDKWTWLNERREAAPGSALFNATFAAMPRHTGKEMIQLQAEELQRLGEIRPGISLQNWSADRLARVWLLLQLDTSDEEKYIASIEQLFRAAEMNELVALYSALPLLAYPDRWSKRCADGIRSNIGDVLEAIICNNPYPAEQLDEPAWNQLVLKAFFTEKPVHLISRLDERLNQRLAETLSDYAHERWAAGRTVHPLIWRCVGPFINDAIFPDIQKIAQSDNELEKEAAALACYYSAYTPAKKLLETLPRLKGAIENGTLTWQTVAQKLD